MALNPAFASPSVRTLPLAYGYVLGIGDGILHTVTSPSTNPDGTTNPGGTLVNLYLLAEGEWDGIEMFAPQAESQLINGYVGGLTKAEYYAGLPSFVHFHSGAWTIKGAGNKLDSTGPDQQYDAFFANFPSVTPPQSYSGIAYVIVSLGEITQGAGGTLRIGTPLPLAPMAIWRANRCRIFDGFGNVTGYGFTTNPAWHKVDAVLRTKIKPQQPALAGLTDAEKACFNWESIAELAARNDFILPNGRPRFVGNYIFAAQSTLTNVMETMLRVDRSYQRVDGNQIYFIADDPRASIFLFGANHLVPGSLKLGKKDVSKAPNVFVPHYRDIDIPAVAEVVTCQTNPVDTSDLGPSYRVFTLKTLSPFLFNDALQYGGAADPSFDAAHRVLLPFTGVTSDKVIDADTQVRCIGPGPGPAVSTTGGYVGTNNARFSERAPTNVQHRSHQRMVAAQAPGLPTQPRVTPVQYDCGNSTFDQTNRLMKFERDRELGTDTGAGWRAPITGTITGFLESVDLVNKKALIDVKQNDVITLDDWVTSEFTGDYVVGDIEVTAANGDSPGQITLQVTQYYPDAYTDVSDDPGSTYATVPSVDLPFGTFPVFNAAWVLQATPVTTIDPSTNKITVTIPDLKIQIMGKPTPTLYPGAQWTGLTRNTPYVIYVDDPAGDGVSPAFGAQLGTLPLVPDPAGRYPVLSRSFNAIPAGSVGLSSEVFCRVFAGNRSGHFSSTAASPLTGDVQFNTLMINTHPQSLLPGDPHASGNQANPMVANEITPNGDWQDDVTIPATEDPCDLVLTGQLVVSVAGNVNFSAYVNSAFVMGVQGANYVSGFQFFGLSTTPFEGLTPLVGYNSNSAPPLTGNWEQVDFTLNFPAPGSYTFEIDIATGLFSEKQFALVVNGGVILPTGPV